MLATSLADFCFGVLVGFCMTMTSSTDCFTIKDTITDMILWKPHAASRSNWVTKTELPFDPFEFLTHQELSCPKCKANVSVCESTVFCEDSGSGLYIRTGYLTSSAANYA
jgi:hypothetical protein